MNSRLHSRRVHFAVLALIVLPLMPREGTSESIARTWVDETLNAIRIDLPHPPVHARNLFHLSVAMYNAWACYDTTADTVIYHQRHAAPDVEAARREAVSYAAYRILIERYALSRNASFSLLQIFNRMVALGYNPNFTSIDPATPAGVGNRVAAAVSAFYLQDGARQTASPAYSDWPVIQGGYVYTNPLLIVADPGAFPLDVNRWQRLRLTAGFAQNGLPVPATQTYLGPQWGGVRPFALERPPGEFLWLDPGPPHWLTSPQTPAFTEQIVELIRLASQLDPSDGLMTDISPGSIGNSSLGSNDGSGHPLNPATGLPYAANVLPLADFGRVLAEYWADGPASETPPGHWNSIANAVMDHPNVERRMAGTGPVLGELEWDVKLYFALNAAMHDAACTAWTLKRHYDGWRPIAMIRYMATQGQSNEPGQPDYNPLGLPLIPDLIERVTASTAASGQRHQGLTPGKIAVRAWPGQPADPINQFSGVHWIHGEDWVPFQSDTFVTPAFPGYVSGHSTFSRAGAEILTAITGSAFFPGGMAVFNAPANQFLRFERGPSVDVQLQWATYYDAADQAGLSRIWGGIHPAADDLSGRIVGATTGQNAWQLARSYFDGSVRSTEPEIIDFSPQGNTSWSSLRGRPYQLEYATHPHGPWFPAGEITANDTRSDAPSPSVPEPTVILRVRHGL